MKLNAIRQQGYQLLHEGIIELSQVEANGIRVNVPLLNKYMDELDVSIREMKADLQKEDIWRTWHKRYGPKANLDSDDQLREVLQDLGYKIDKLTKSGQMSVDTESLSQIDHPFFQAYQLYSQHEKARNTFLKGIQKEIVGDRFHPVFNLHTVLTYRSSCNDPNFQNVPARNEKIAKICRSILIASLRSLLVEKDFKGIEVAISACYHKDKKFIRYLEDKDTDMHRDMAKQLYCLTDEEWAKLDKKNAKNFRQGAKNKFVFPQFYGDYYLACAKGLWEWIDKQKMVGPNGEPFKEFLKKKGIHSRGACNPEEKPEPGTFEKHVQEVENDFWNNRFGDYGKWRKQWYGDYLEKGYFDIYTGFRVFGKFSRNQVTNAPIQGSAFHCLLWTLIQTNKALRKYRMKSKVIGQIHDSLLGDVRDNEFKDYNDIVDEIAMVKLRKHYPWIDVPLEMETEVCPPDGSLYDKKPLVYKNGQFKHPEKDIWTPNPDVYLRALTRL